MATPRRTHTADNMTIREGGIILYLLSKVYASDVPEDFELSKGAVTRAFNVVGGFALACIAEAESGLAALEVEADAGDEKAAKQLKSQKKALAEIREFQRKGRYSELLGTLGRRAKK